MKHPKGVKFAGVLAIVGLVAFLVKAFALMFAGFSSLHKNTAPKGLPVIAARPELKLEAARVAKPEVCWNDESKQVRKGHITFYFCKGDGRLTAAKVESKDPEDAMYYDHKDFVVVDTLSEAIKLNYQTADDVNMGHVDCNRGYSDGKIRVNEKTGAAVLSYPSCPHMSPLIYDRYVYRGSEFVKQWEAEPERRLKFLPKKRP